MAFSREIIWRNTAKLYLQKAVDYIRQDSPQNADLVANAIIAAIEKAAGFQNIFLQINIGSIIQVHSGLLKFIVLEFHFTIMTKH